MKLAAYVSKHFASPADFARKVGHPVSTVIKWLRDERCPRPEAMRKISTVTKGAVTANDFYPQPKKKAS